LYNAWELESGEIGSVQEIRREMAAKLRDYYVNKTFTALGSVWSAINTPTNYTSVGGTITATALEDAIDEVNRVTPGAKAVLGMRSVMTPITKFGAFWDNGSGTVEGSQNAIDEVRQNGILGRYYGVPLIALDQVFDNPEDYNALLPTERILVIGEDVGDFITYGDVRTKQFEDMFPTPPQWHLELFAQFGLIIDKAQGIYVLGNVT